MSESAVAIDKEKFVQDIEHAKSFYYQGDVHQAISEWEGKQRYLWWD